MGASKGWEVWAMGWEEVERPPAKSPAARMVGEVAKLWISEFLSSNCHLP